MQKDNFIQDSKVFDDVLEAIDYYHVNYNLIQNKLKLRFKGTFKKINGKFFVEIIGIDKNKTIEEFLPETNKK